MSERTHSLTEEHVLFEDNHLLIVNKPAGWLTQGDQTGDDSLVERARRFLKAKYDKPGNVYVGLAHRIDRPVSGVVVLTKTSKALPRMTKLFQQRKVQKEYIALTAKKPKMPKGKLEDHLWKDRSKNVVKVVSPDNKDGQLAVLDYELIGVFKDRNVLRITPQTGRPHQIRVQLANMGCSIIGDLKYGAPEPLADKSIALHARSVEFIHPVRKEPLKVEAPLPELDVWSEVKNVI